MRRLQLDEVSADLSPCREDVSTTYSDLQSWYTGTILGYRVGSSVVPFEVYDVINRDDRLLLCSGDDVYINYRDPSITYALPDLGLIEWRGAILNYTRTNRRQWRRGNRSSLISANWVGEMSSSSPPRLEEALALFYNDKLCRTVPSKVLSNKFAIDSDGSVYYLNNVIGQAVITDKDLTITLDNQLMAFPLSLTLQDSRYAKHSIRII